jgi:hypothetical protein
MAERIAGFRAIEQQADRDWTHMTQKPLASPFDVWQALRRGGRGRRLAGGLEPNGRDESLVSDLRRELHRWQGRPPEAREAMIDRNRSTTALHFVGCRSDSRGAEWDPFASFSGLQRFLNLSS